MSQTALDCIAQSCWSNRHITWLDVSRLRLDSNASVLRLMQEDRPTPLRALSCDVGSASDFDLLIGVVERNNALQSLSLNCLQSSSKLPTLIGALKKQTFLQSLSLSTNDESCEVGEALCDMIAKNRSISSFDTNYRFAKGDFAHKLRQALRQNLSLR